MHVPGCMLDPVVQTWASHAAQHLTGLLIRADLPGMTIPYAMIEEYNPFPKMMLSEAADITQNT